MAFKLYRSLKAITFGTNIIIGTGKDMNIIPIMFTGGSTHTGIVRGTFGTHDKELQHAIENDSQYGIEFSLDVSFVDAEKDEKKDASDGSTVFVESVTNASEAKKYILENFTSISPEEISNVEKLKVVCGRLNIKFSNYKL